MGNVKQRNRRIRKRWGIILISMFCMGMVAGCQETPEDAIVRQKKSDNIKKYESNEENPEETAKKNQEGTEENQENAAEQKKNVKRVLEAPEYYKNKTSYQNDNLIIDTDAEVLVPEDEYMNTYKVTAQEMNQDLIDHITQAFFEGDKIYHEYGYFQWTKEQYQQDITTLKNIGQKGTWIPTILEPMRMGVRFLILTMSLNMMKRV